MSKGLVIAASLLLLGFNSLGAQAITIDVTSTSPTVKVSINSGNDTTCALYPSSDSLSELCQYSNNNQGNDTAEFDLLAGLNLAYKDEKNGESGGLKGSYNSTFVEGSNDITITHVDGTDFIDCGLGCWLVMKDGNTDPARYLFNLALIGFSGWDGKAALELTDFFTGKSISHAALFTGGDVPAVPVPAAVWLFGTALLGFFGLSRKTSV